MEQKNIEVTLYLSKDTVQQVAVSWNKNQKFDLSKLTGIANYTKMKQIARTDDINCNSTNFHQPRVYMEYIETKEWII